MPSWTAPRVDALLHCATHFFYSCTLCSNLCSLLKSKIFVYACLGKHFDVALCAYTIYFVQRPKLTTLGLTESNSGRDYSLHRGREYEKLIQMRQLKCTQVGVAKNPPSPQKGARCPGTSLGERPFSPFLCLRLSNSLIRLLTRLSALFYIKTKTHSPPLIRGFQTGFLFHAATPHGS